VGVPPAKFDVRYESYENLVKVILLNVAARKIYCATPSTHKSRLSKILIVGTVKYYTR
jgi:hypothetical protein